MHFWAQTKYLPTKILKKVITIWTSSIFLDQYSLNSEKKPLQLLNINENLHLGMQKKSTFYAAYQKVSPYLLALSREKSITILILSK